MPDLLATPGGGMRHPLFSQPSTIGDLYTAVFSIHDGAAARAFYEDYVAYTREFATDPQYRTEAGAVALVKSNIGWVFGESMPSQDIVMWTEACGASHPVFGDGILTVTPGDALRAGREAAGA